MADVEKLKQRLREEITRTTAGVRLDLNLEKGTCQGGRRRETDDGRAHPRRVVRARAQDQGGRHAHRERDCRCAYEHPECQVQRAPGTSAAVEDSSADSSTLSVWLPVLVRFCWPTCVCSAEARRRPHESGGLRSSCRCICTACCEGTPAEEQPDEWQAQPATRPMAITRVLSLPAAPAARSPRSCAASSPAATPTVLATSGRCARRHQLRHVIVLSRRGSHGAPPRNIALLAHHGYADHVAQPVPHQWAGPHDAGADADAYVHPVVRRGGRRRRA